LACVHKFKVQDGQVTYSSKFLETNAYTKSLKENKVLANFGSVDICSSLFGRLKTAFVTKDTPDNVNVNIVPYANKQLYAITETNHMSQIDPKNLDVIKKIKVTDYIADITTTSAHPHVERDGSWITGGLHPKDKTYRFIRFNNSLNKNNDNSDEIICKNGSLINKIQSRHKAGLSYFHSFGLTENFIVFLEQSLEFNLKKFFKNIIKNKPFSEALVMHENMNTRIHIINKKTGQLLEQKYETEPLLLFHHINAYEEKLNSEDLELHVDVCAYDPKQFEMNILSYEDSFTDKLSGSEALRTVAKRIKIPISKKIKSDKMKNEKDSYVFCEIENLNIKNPFELPTINYNKYNGLKYKYAYGVNLYKKPFSIVKINTQNKSEAIEKAYDEEGVECLPTEPVFVEKPNASSEDDGVLLVMVLSSKNDFLSVLDAKNLNEIARANIPEQVKAAFTFHGFFADNLNFSKLNV
jgi:carotenoid cleavage dioxygenase-like enzyme